jgi:glutamine synthetase
VDVLQQHILPSVQAAIRAGCTALESRLAQLQTDTTVLQDALHDLHSCINRVDEDRGRAQALQARVLRLETMERVRGHVDAAEALVPAQLWTLATYKELLFLDQHTA